MLETEGLANCLPGCKSIADGVQVYHRFRNYRHKAKQVGVLAFRIAPRPTTQRHGHQEENHHSTFVSTPIEDDGPTVEHHEDMNLTEMTKKENEEQKPITSRRSLKRKIEDYTKQKALAISNGDFLDADRVKRHIKLCRTLLNSKPTRQEMQRRDRKIDERKIMEQDIADVPSDEDDE